MIIIYPKVIFRNLLATLNQSENYDCVQASLRSSKKAKEKFEVQAKLGEAVHTKADENSTVDIVMKVQNMKFVTPEPIMLKATNMTTTLRNNHLQFTANLQLAQNKLSRVLTLLPSRIFRNFTDHKFVIYFAQEPSFKKVTQIFPLSNAQAQPTSVLYSGDYCYFGVEGISGTSSAIKITEPGVEQFYVGHALICL